MNHDFLNLKRLELGFQDLVEDACKKGLLRQESKAAGNLAHGSHPMLKGLEERFGVKSGPAMKLQHLALVGCDLERVLDVIASKSHHTLLSLEFQYCFGLPKGWANSKKFPKLDRLSIRSEIFNDRHWNLPATVTNLPALSNLHLLLEAISPRILEQTLKACSETLQGLVVNTTNPRSGNLNNRLDCICQNCPKLTELGIQVDLVSVEQSGPQHVSQILPLEWLKCLLGMTDYLFYRRPVNGSDFLTSDISISAIRQTWIPPI